MTGVQTCALPICDDDDDDDGCGYDLGWHRHGITKTYCCGIAVGGVVVCLVDLVGASLFLVVVDRKSVV